MYKAVVELICINTVMGLLCGAFNVRYPLRSLSALNASRIFSSAKHNCGPIACFQNMKRSYKCLASFCVGCLHTEMCGGGHLASQQAQSQHRGY